MSVPAMQPTYGNFKAETRQQAAAAQYECAAHALRSAVCELYKLHGIENTSYWEWDQHQPPTYPLRLPIEFSVWTLMREAELLEARARVLRGKR